MHSSRRHKTIVLRGVSNIDGQQATCLQWSSSHSNHITCNFHRAKVAQFNEEDFRFSPIVELLAILSNRLLTKWALEKMHARCSQISRFKFGQLFLRNPSSTRLSMEANRRLRWTNWFWEIGRTLRIGTRTPTQKLFPIASGHKTSTLLTNDSGRKRMIGLWSDRFQITSKIKNKYER